MSHLIRINTVCHSVFDFRLKPLFVSKFKNGRIHLKTLVAVNFQPQHVWKLPGRSSRICYQFSLHVTSLSKQVAVCTALVCRVQCSMPVRLGYLHSQTSSVCSEMTGQWSDRSAMSGGKTLSPPGPMSYLSSLALRIWTSFWRREDSDGMDMWNAPMVQSRQPLTYRLMESVGLGSPRWHRNSWQRGITESGSSQPSTLMLDIPGDLVWELPCVQQASYLEGGPLVWMLPLYLYGNQKSNYYDDVLLNKLRCHAHFLFSANQITWSGLLL